MIHLLMLEKNMVRKNILYGITIGTVQKTSLTLLAKEIKKLKMKQIYGKNIGQGEMLYQKKVLPMVQSCQIVVNSLIMPKRR